MKDILFTADPHFGHANIIKHCDRPWKEVEAHDDALVARWNAVVTPRDTVYVLGDFAMIKKVPGVCSMKLYRKMRSRLNGKIHLVLGNHDKMSQEVYNTFSAVYDGIKEVKIDGEKVVLCHYPMRSWNRSCHGGGHLFGHVHGRLEKVDTGVSFDVGVDVPEWDYTPVPWEYVKIKLDEKREKFLANRNW